MNGTWACCRLRSNAIAWAERRSIPDTCHFSPQALFCAQIFSTQYRVNRNKPILRQNSVNRKIPKRVHIMKEISDFSTPVMWRNLKSLHMWINLRFLHIYHVKLIHMWRNLRFLHICHVLKFEMSPHDIFFLHGHRPWCPWQISGMFWC